MKGFNLIQLGELCPSPKVGSLMISIFLISILANVSYAQSPMHESPTKQLTEEDWQEFHDHDGINFSGQLGECDNNQILKLKVINRTPKRSEVRISFLNGTQRLGAQVFVLQPIQELTIECANPLGIPPITLVEGSSVRIETQVIQLN